MRRVVNKMLIAGVDEAGRGPLAGPVVAAAVILPENYQLSGLNDSKKISANQRARLFDLIQQQAVSCAFASASVEEIDQLNILQATLLAMRRAVVALGQQPMKVLVDGNRCPILDIETQAIVNGDALVPVISAASIIAKQVRDQYMLELDRLYPDYGFAQHKGYPTKLHHAALARHGVTPIHRRSYAPVRAYLTRHANTTG